MGFPQGAAGILAADEGDLMAKVLNGRHMADLNGLGSEVVVFMLGMRINKPRKVRLWLSVMTAMPKMLKYLDAHPEKGLLGYRISLVPPFMVQYWRSFEDLERFARDADDPHLEPWRQYNRRVGKSGDVGIWHETYRVKTTDIETAYSNMPPYGLAAVTAMVPVPRGMHSAAARMGVTDRDEPALPPY
ncbi:DUF4188 domain-containing protein [Mycobacterium hubeiense]|uniref:DUF4188 domain-containing protein n=1 Tax=Mycobacterium hubeiense TaxID=1867256 RepID=UPI0018EA9788|nr:DUF4188 domain-containing protein [Mycobacterium sp. QGD 101]